MLPWLLQCCWHELRMAVSTLFRCERLSSAWQLGWDCSLLGWAACTHGDSTLWIVLTAYPLTCCVEEYALLVCCIGCCAVLCPCQALADVLASPSTASKSIAARADKRFFWNRVMAAPIMGEWTQARSMAGHGLAWEPLTLCTVCA